MKEKPVKGLAGSIGVIVCDLPEPDKSPYYRLDPARFPDVKSMAAQVKELTGGATLMPNIKPTGVDSSAKTALRTHFLYCFCTFKGEFRSILGELTPL